jgi:hypothetical protein
MRATASHARTVWRTCAVILGALLFWPSKAKREGEAKVGRGVSQRRRSILEEVIGWGIKAEQTKAISRNLLVWQRITACFYRCRFGDLGILAHSFLDWAAPRRRAWRPAFPGTRIAWRPRPVSTGAGQAFLFSWGCRRDGGRERPKRHGPFNAT